MSASFPDLDAQAIEVALARPQQSAGSASTLHHIAFAVSDMVMAMRHWSMVFGVGPFCRIKDRDPLAPQPAFVWWGTVFVEFIQMKMDEEAPRILVSAFDHVSYMTAAPREEGERIARLGFDKRSELRRGPVWSQQYNGDGAIGCAIEVHRAGLEMAHFFNSVRAAALSWDGKELEIAISPPGSQAADDVGH